MLISCKKQDLPAKPEASAFSASLESNSVVPASGGTVNVLISTQTDGWWISNLSASWATVNRTYGSGNFKLPVTVKANTSGVKRSVNLQVNPTFGLPAVNLTINQDN
nr:BACON domain-containing carbohydrate-binding protein [Pedobacter sp. ASV19]